MPDKPTTEQLQLALDMSGVTAFLRSCREHYKDPKLTQVKLDNIIDHSIKQVYRLCPLVEKIDTGVVIWEEGKNGG